VRHARSAHADQVDAAGDVPAREHEERRQVLVQTERAAQERAAADLAELVDRDVAAGHDAVAEPHRAREQRPVRDHAAVADLAVVPAWLLVIQ
jgi:hypothetical protein